VDSTQAFKKQSNFRRSKKNESGIALAMVLAAIAVLSILITEFTYIAQVNQKMAFDALDRVKAYYLAKSGLKISLLRLKAYQTIKGTMNAMNGDAKQTTPGVAPGTQPGLPKEFLDKIWSFPFIYPIPTSMLGVSLGNQDMLSKFEKESNLEGTFTATIESESSRYNLNMILAPFVPIHPSSSPSPTAPIANNMIGGQSVPTPAPSGSPTPRPSFNPEAARESLADYLQQILGGKIDGDDSFSSEYRDYAIQDLVDNLAAWADPTYERKNNNLKDAVPMKRGPFYSLSELHMVPGMDDYLFDLFAPSLTVSTTPGVNINTIQELSLKALIPQMSDDEIKEFFKFRDSVEEDNLFKQPDASDFFTYLVNSVGAFNHSEIEVAKFKDSLIKRNIRLVVDETEFKITVRSQVNQSARQIEAWVKLTPPKASKNSKDSLKDPLKDSPENSNQTTPDSGLKITFMRVL